MKNDKKRGGDNLLNRRISLLKNKRGKATGPGRDRKPFEKKKGEGDIPCESEPLDEVYLRSWLRERGGEK